MRWIPLHKSCRRRGKANGQKKSHEEEEEKKTQLLREGRGKIIPFRCCKTDAYFFVSFSFLPRVSLLVRRERKEEREGGEALFFKKRDEGRESSI